MSKVAVRREIKCGVPYCDKSRFVGRTCSGQMELCDEHLLEHIQQQRREAAERRRKLIKAGRAYCVVRSSGWEAGSLLEEHEVKRITDDGYFPADTVLKRGGRLYGVIRYEPSSLKDDEQIEFLPQRLIECEP